MDLTTSKLYVVLEHTEKILEERIAAFGFGRKENELELAAVRQALNALSQPQTQTWEHW
jgi:hypothetical protein